MKLLKVMWFGDKFLLIKTDHSIIVGPGYQRRINNSWYVDMYLDPKPRKRKSRVN